MSLTVYWTRFAENKIDDIYEYYELKLQMFLTQDEIQKKWMRFDWTE